MLGVADGTTSEPASRPYLQECFTKTKFLGPGMVLKSILDLHIVIYMVCTDNYVLW